MLQETVGITLLTEIVEALRPTYQVELLQAISQQLATYVDQLPLLSIQLLMAMRPELLSLQEIFKSMEQLQL